MTEIRLYVPEDYEKLTGWQEAWGQLITPVEMLPTIGAVGDEMAIAFLYQTDSTVCHIDGVVCDPGARPIHRARAVSAVIRYLYDTASNLGFTYCVGFTQRDGIEHVVRNLGGATNPNKMVIEGFVRRRTDGRCTR